MFTDLELTINGSPDAVKINSKTGEFSIPVQVLKNTKTLIVAITAGDYHISKVIPFTIDSVKENVLLQNIAITDEEFSIVNVKMMGAVNINYTR